MEQDATAIANQLVDANLFDITGPIRINYSASSFQGGPWVSYKDADLDLNFQDDEITRIQTPRASWSPSPWTTRSTPSPAPSPWSSRPSASLEARRSSSPPSGSRQPTVRARSSRPRARPGCSRPTRSTSSGAPPSTSSFSRETGQMAGAEPSFLRTAATPPPPGRLTVRTRVRNQRRTAMTRQQSPRRASPARGDTGAAPSSKEQ